MYQHHMIHFPSLHLFTYAFRGEPGNEAKGLLAFLSSNRVAAYVVALYNIMYLHVHEYTHIMYIAYVCIHVHAFPHLVEVIQRLVQVGHHSCGRFVSDLN